MIQIEFKTEVTLEKCLEEEYMITTTGRIFHRDDEEKEVNIGTMTAVLVDADRIARAGLDLWIEADRHSGELESLVSTFYQEGEIKSGILKGWGMRLPNLLYVDTIEIKPRFRGRGIGLAAIQRAAEILSVNCDVVALLPSPITRSTRVIDAAGRKKLRVAVTKLRRYYRRLGFRKVEGEDYMVLDLPSFAKDALLDPDLFDDEIDKETESERSHHAGGYGSTQKSARRGRNARMETEV